MKLFGTAPNKRVAAIAQSVERILGKDEVASSNLASSSIIQMKPIVGYLTGDLVLCAKRDSIVRSQGFHEIKDFMEPGSQFKSG